MPQSYFRSLLAMERKPYYGLVPLFPPGQDLSWIPDLGALGLMAPVFSAEAPAGIVATAGNTWTFSGVPQWLVYNGQLLKKGTDYTVAGNVATTTNTLNVGDEVYALL